MECSDGKQVRLLCVRVRVRINDDAGFDSAFVGSRTGKGRQCWRCWLV